ncbi:MAG: protein kinase [bacterium]
MDDQQGSPNAPRGRRISAGGATRLPSSSAVGLLVDGRYRIVEPIAAGGMGSVYRGEQDNLRRRVAIKRVAQPDPDSAMRFRREAEALAMVSHPAIVEIYDFVHDADTAVSYMVMAFVDGENVADYVATQPNHVLPPLETLDLAIPIASALVELHARGILHRDIKPANLVRYLCADGHAAVKLVDFGIARREQDAGLTADGRIVGTPPYIPPEVILGGKHTEASDVYALGATLFELLTGVTPHGKDEVQNIFKRAIREDVQLPPTMSGTPLGALLLRMLSRQEDQRPSTQGVLEELVQLRLSLLLADGDTNKALEATRKTAAFSSLAAAAPSAEEATMSLRRPLDPAAALRGEATDSSDDTGRTSAAHPSRLPWLIAGVSLAAAMGVSLFFTLREPPPVHAPTAQPAPPTAVVATPPRPMSDPRPVSRARPTPPPSMKATPNPMKPASAKDDAAGERCDDPNQAYRLFKKATYYYRIDKRLPWARGAFQLLLDCRHTSLGQRRWVAYRLAKLHQRAGECALAARRWQQYLTAAKKLGIPPERQPPCPTTRR